MKLKKNNKDKNKDLNYKNILSKNRNNSNEKEIDPNDNNNIDEESLHTKKHYINEELYQYVREHKNLKPDLVKIENIMGDGNCFYRSMSYFFTGTESNYRKYRYEIYLHALNNRNIFPNIYIET